MKESIFTYLVQQANKQHQLDSDVGTRLSSTLRYGVSEWGVTTPAHLCSGDLQKQDEDDMLAVINAMISAHQYTHIANKKAAYQALNAVMAPYRGIRAHEYSRQTAEVNGLLTEFQSPSNAEHVQTLGLSEEIEMLTLANAKFSVEFNQKTAEMASRLPEKETSTVEARAECDRLYAEIVALINAYALIQPSEEITGFVQQQTGLVETYRIISANTGKSKENIETPEAENV